MIRTLQQQLSHVNSS